jgi:hypothetical protein
MKKLIILLFIISNLNAQIINLILLETINISKINGTVKAYLDDNLTQGKIILNGIYKMQFQSDTNTVIEINWYSAKYNNSTKDINLRTALSSNTNIIATSIVKAKGELKNIYELKNLMKIKYIAKKEVSNLTNKLNLNIKENKKQFAYFKKLTKNLQKEISLLQKEIINLKQERYTINNEPLEIINFDDNKSNTIEKDTNISIATIEDI